MPYSDTPKVPPTAASLMNKMLLAPSMPSTDAQVMLCCTGQILCNPRMLSQSLLISDSHDPCKPLKVQKALILPEEPTSVHRHQEAPSLLDGAPRRKPPVSRPYFCQHGNRGKVYTKHTHLASHQYIHRLEVL